MAEPAARVPDVREWAGDPPWPVAEAVEAGRPIVACYYLEAVEQALTRNQKPYLRLRLFDQHGHVDGRVWDDAERIGTRIQARTYVGVRGRVEVFNDRRQLKIEQIVRVRVNSEDLGLFLPRSRRDPAEMAAELDAVIASISDSPLRILLERLLGSASEIGQRFRDSPAANRKHHACVGGLLEHTLSVAGVCDALARHYGAAVDRDLLVSGALLHDIGKVREICVEAGFPYTDEGKLLGHILLGLRMVGDAALDVPELTQERRLLLLHLIASHQGRYEWQSPREPRLLEALLLHHADDLDAKMWQALQMTHAVGSGWTRYNRTFNGELFGHGSAPLSEAERAGVQPGPVAESRGNGPVQASDRDSPPGTEQEGRALTSEEDVAASNRDSELWGEPEGCALTSEEDVAASDPDPDFGAGRECSGADSVAGARTVADASAADSTSPTSPVREADQSSPELKRTPTDRTETTRHPKSARDAGATLDLFRE